jgi:hypothetical protein
MEFIERSIKVKIDTSKCPQCTTKACIAACKTYDRELLHLENGIPTVNYISADEVVKRGTECLACEYACWKKGLDAIRIDIPIKGLEDYKNGKPLRGSK